MDPHLVELFFCSYMILIGLVLMNVVRSPSSARNMSSRRAHNLSSLASLSLSLSLPACHHLLRAFPFKCFDACSWPVLARNMSPRV